MSTEERSEQADQTNITWGANAASGPNSLSLWVLQRGLLLTGSLLGPPPAWVCRTPVSPGDAVGARFGTGRIVSLPHPHPASQEVLKLLGLWGWESIYPHPSSPQPPTRVFSLCLHLPTPSSLSNPIC